MDDDDLIRRLRRVYAERHIHEKLSKQCTGFSVDVQRIIDVVDTKILPYFHKVFKTPNDVSLDRLSDWVQHLFTKDSVMQVGYSRIARHDETHEFMVYAVLKYKSASVPILIVGRDDLPNLGFSDKY